MELPIVIVPVGVDDEALDACLGALEIATPAGTRVWLADDALAGPRVRALVDRWIGRTRMQADYTRRQRSIGEAAHLDQVLDACGEADVVVLADDAQPAPGWLSHLAACAGDDGAVASATPWSNAGETVSWPRIGEINAVPSDVQRVARAAAAMPGLCAEVPGAVSHAVYLRGTARVRAGGLDTASFRSWYAALADLSLRMAGLGWRNVHCDRAFVARRGEGLPGEGDMDALAGRWPGWHARVANFLMDDPLRPARERLQSLCLQIAREQEQGDLFV